MQYYIKLNSYRNKIYIYLPIPLKRIYSIRYFPVEIPLKFIKPLQSLLEIIAYASDVDYKTKIIDTFFDERGPIPLSPIYDDFYDKPDVSNGSGTPIGGYKQILRSSEKLDEDFIMEEILEVLQVNFPDQLVKNAKNI